MGVILWDTNLEQIYILSLQFKGSRKTSEVEIDEIDKEYKPGLMRQARELIETFWKYIRTCYSHRSHKKHEIS